MHLTIDKIIQYAEGNPGALRGLMDISTQSNPNFAEAIMQKLDACPSIRGTNLYVLYNDLAHGVVEMMYKICNSCPARVLEDACGRQDYSGVELIAEYLEGVA